MTERLQKLELTWIGKDKRPRLEPRILLEDQELSHHARFRRADDDIFDNRLIFGDNLLALKALEQEYTGRVKCVFIDPPYNTGSAFEHYNDGLEHSIWLGLMRDRLELLKLLLRDDGSIWITIDDNEAHYLKVLCDEVFGRKNFVATIIWQKLFTVKNSAKYFSDMHEYLLVYAKYISSWNRNLLPRSTELDSSYTNPDNDPRGLWTTNAIQARNYYSQGTYEINSPTGRTFTPPAGTYWRIAKNTFDELEKDGRIWWGKDGTAIPRIKKFLSEAKQGVVPATIWFHEDVGTNAKAKIEVRALFEGIGDGDIFMTPKPEKLIQRILEIATTPGDLVLDSFAGSGTTGAVAHKMGRRWIMIELGNHCHTHIIPRLKKVINDEDPGGISEAVNWHGGGGFRYYKLAPSLLAEDGRGFPVINPEYNAAMLAEAMCKLMGFRYQPSTEIYWQHGQSTESCYIYVTTLALEQGALALISAEVGPERSLLICCPGWRGPADQFPNLILKKIPKAVLNRCEWGHDDYSLNIKNLPMLRPEPLGRKGRATEATAPSLFDQLEEAK
ncbi:MAG: site-specific DNA-methyltransferase [Deltaproteobacteria bacterium]|jgi:adenine-specific DNA-methyltransferase|nr:site-specific DNA-methyltransferase [Deltaproteobacteria bacterium]